MHALAFALVGRCGVSFSSFHSIHCRVAVGVVVLVYVIVAGVGVICAAVPLQFDFVFHVYLCLPKK